MRSSHLCWNSETVSQADEKIAALSAAYEASKLEHAEALQAFKSSFESEQTNHLATVQLAVDQRQAELEARSAELEEQRADLESSGAETRRLESSLRARASELEAQSSQLEQRQADVATQRAQVEEQSACKCRGVGRGALVGALSLVTSPTPDIV